MRFLQFIERIGAFGMFLIYAIIVAFLLMLLTGDLFAQREYGGSEGVTLSVTGESRGARSLFQNPNTSSAALGGIRDFPAAPVRSSESDSAAADLSVPFAFNGQRTGFAVGLSYRGTDLRFDRAPFQGSEFNSDDWWLREYLIETDVIKKENIPAYEFETRFSDLHAPGAVPLEGFTFERLAERRYDQYLLDSTALPFLSEVWHLPIDRRRFKLEEAAATLEGFHSLGGDWFLMGSVSSSVGRENGQKVRRDSIFHEGFLGPGYYFGSDLSIGLGAALSMSFGDAPRTFPLLFIEWKPTERFTVEALLPYSLEAKYWPGYTSSLGAGVSLESSGHGLRENDTQLFSTQVDAFLSYELYATEAVFFQLRAGATVYHNHDLYRRGNLLYQYESSDAAFARLVATVVLFGEENEEFE